MERVYYTGCALPNSGNPGDINGYTLERLLRSLVDGIFRSAMKIGDLVSKGETLALVGDYNVKAEIDGLLRDPLFYGSSVRKGQKVGDFDPRGSEVDYHMISNKARSIGGGVLEAILHLHVKT